LPVHREVAIELKFRRLNHTPSGRPDSKTKIDLFEPLARHEQKDPLGSIIETVLQFMMVAVVDGSNDTVLHERADGYVT
jgi:hypothetical protein